MKVDLNNDGIPDMRPEYDLLREYANPGEQFIRLIFLHEPPNLTNESYKMGSVKYAYKFDVDSNELSISTKTETFFLNMNEREVQVRK